eukprot:TRINITY_DN4884_c1_g1_i1.p1 TRINITY_DN4884_c1_g1~~TRINITY_DN4884_c1_g1_i1.p1  ORF type:complete len:223 (+),score=73.85 TRINITY_DN4884_c1_g1_i1:153-821(+)
MAAPGNVRYSAQAYNERKVKAGGVSVNYNERGGGGGGPVGEGDTQQRKDLYQHPYAVPGRTDLRHPDMPHFSHTRFDVEKKHHASPIRSVHDRKGGVPAGLETPLTDPGAASPPRQSYRELSHDISVHRAEMDSHRRARGEEEEEEEEGYAGESSHTALKKRIAVHVADMQYEVSPERARPASPRSKGPKRSDACVSHRVLREEMMRGGTRPRHNGSKTVTL